MRKMHLKRLNRRSGSIGRSTLFGNQAASTIQTNSDLQTSWSAAHFPQTVSWWNDVTICLEIDCVNWVTSSSGISRVYPVRPRPHVSGDCCIRKFFYADTPKNPHKKICGYKNLRIRVDGASVNHSDVWTFPTKNEPVRSAQVKTSWTLQTTTAAYWI